MSSPVTLSWMPKGLSPNDRVHWSAKAKVVKAYRHEAATLARAGRWHMRASPPGLISVTFCPPSGWRTGDMDNLIARFKAGQDGLADALGINDAKLKFQHRLGERCQHGAVIVEIDPEHTEPLP